MKISPHVFRAYDIRGLYPAELNEDVTYQIGLAYGKLLGQAKTIAVGHDGRPGSKAVKKSLIKALMFSGKDVIDIGLVPSPVLYFAISHYNLDGGIEITGSHNPSEYTGLKLQKEMALPIVGETGIYRMRDWIMNGDIRIEEQKSSLTTKNVIPDYVNYLISKTKLKRPLKIIIDVGNGSCGRIPETIFKKMGCDVQTLYPDIDGTFPNHIPDPHEHETLKELQKKVVEEGADVGLAFDGDGDRVGMVDERGGIVPGDLILMMLARKVLRQRKGHVVVEVRASKTLLEDIKRHGGKPVFSRAGHAYVLQEVFDKKAVFGGELTGHMYFPLEYYDYDDGLFISMKLAELVSEMDALSEYVKKLPQGHTSPEIFIECPENEKFKVVEKLKDFLKTNGYDFLGIDGARINFKNGWALIRASNTTPYLKCRFEGDTEEDLKKVKKEAREILKAVGIHPNF
jgi:phosphomannomutase/phosphoglucomutase